MRPRKTQPKPTSAPVATAPVPTPAAALTPMEMLSIAMQNPNFNPDTLEKLMDLAERWERDQARRAYGRAFVAAKAEIDVIAKNKSVKYDSKDANKAGARFDYAGLDDVYKEIVPVLSKHGLTHSYKSKQDDGKLTVTCMLTHESGHIQDGAEISAKDDKSGGKNDIQAVTSTATYLQRVTVMLTLGLAAGKDDDGKAAGIQAFATPGQIKLIGDLMGDTDTVIADSSERLTRFGTFLEEKFGTTEISNLTPAHASQVIDALKKKKAQA